MRALIGECSDSEARNALGFLCNIGDTFFLRGLVVTHVSHQTRDRLTSKTA